MRMKNRVFPRGYWRENMTRNADEKSVRIFLVYPGLPSPRSFSIFDNFFKFSNHICAMFKKKILEKVYLDEIKERNFSTLRFLIYREF